MVLTIKQHYISFIEKTKHSFGGKLLYIFLYCLSLLYGFLIALRNFFYDRGILSSYNPDSSFLIGVGNISWAGTGKTPFCLWLYKELNLKFKTGILRRGYGKDEEELIKSESGAVFSSPNRLRLVKNLEKGYQLFVLDDSFQYRKLKKDLNIVIMGQREFKRKRHLIPVSFFRESFQSLKRAEVIIINYKEKVDRQEVKKELRRLAPASEVYFSDYRAVNLEGLDGSIYNLDFLKNQKIAGFAAIGYPEGFFELLEKTGYSLARKIKYPDHYNLSGQEYYRLERGLMDSGIKNLVITKKDKYHLPGGEKKINIFILNARLKIEGGETLIDAITKKIKAKLK